MCVRCNFDIIRSLIWRFFVEYVYENEQVQFEIIQCNLNVTYNNLQLYVFVSAVNSFFLFFFFNAPRVVSHTIYFHMLMCLTIYDHTCKSVDRKSKSRKNKSITNLKKSQKKQNKFYAKLYRVIPTLCIHTIQFALC